MHHTILSDLNPLRSFISSNDINQFSHYILCMGSDNLISSLHFIFVMHLFLVEPSSLLGINGLCVGTSTRKLKCLWKFNFKFLIFLGDTWFLNFQIKNEFQLMDMHVYLFNSARCTQLWVSFGKLLF